MKIKKMKRKWQQKHASNSSQKQAFLKRKSHSKHPISEENLELKTPDLESKTPDSERKSSDQKWLPKTAVKTPKSAKKTEVKTRARMADGWRDEYYLQAYEMAKDGATEYGIGEALGIRKYRWQRWLTEKPALKEAIHRGKEAGGRNTQPGGTSIFMDYVYKRLPNELRGVWERIVELENDLEEPNAETLLEALTEKLGKTARQHLWVHALVSSNFNSSEACRRVKVSMQSVHNWVKSDPGFGAILQQIHEAKKDFVEGSLFRLIQRGDSPATIFASKTLNSDRGYNPKTEVNHLINGEVKHLHELVDVQELDALPLEDRLRILNAMKSKRKELSAPTEIVTQNLHEEESLD